MKSINISESVNKLSFIGCKSILEDLPHVAINSFFDLDMNESEILQSMKEVIQLNINNNSLDEIDILIVLSGE